VLRRESTMGKLKVESHFPVVQPPDVTEELPRPVYKPHSVQLLRACAIIYLEEWLPNPSRGLPGTYRDEQPHRSCLALLLVGVAWPRPLLNAPVVSYTTFSPSPSDPETRWQSFSVALSGKLLHPGSYPAPSSVECGLSSGDILPRSPDQPG
jgi:hypothetical protein